MPFNNIGMPATTFTLLQQVKTGGTGAEISGTDKQVAWPGTTAEQHALLMDLS